MSRLALGVVVIFSVCCSASAATLHVDAFLSSTEEWVGGAMPTHIPSGGPAGAGDGFLQLSANGDFLATYNDDSRWTGSLTAIGAQRVEVDLMSLPGSDPLAIRLVLFGPTSINNRWVSTNAYAVPSDGAWRRYAFDISEASLTRVAGAGTYDQLMQDTVRIMLRHNPTPSPIGSAVTAMLGVDNISLSAIPEPTSAVLALSFAAVLWRRQFSDCNLAGERFRKE